MTDRSSYFALRFALIDRIMTANLSPESTAELLDRYRCKFDEPVIASLLAQESNLLHAMGGAWRPVNWTTGELAGETGLDGRPVAEDNSASFLRNLAAERNYRAKTTPG